MNTLAIVKYMLMWPPTGAIGEVIKVPTQLHFHLVEVSAHAHKYVCGACATRDSSYDDSRYSSGSFPKRANIDEIPDKAAGWMMDHAEIHVRIGMWALNK